MEIVFRFFIEIRENYICFWQKWLRKWVFCVVYLNYGKKTIKEKEDNWNLGSGYGNGYGN